MRQSNRYIEHSFHVPSTAQGSGPCEGKEGCSWTSEGSEANGRHKETNFITKSRAKCMLDRCACIVLGVCLKKKAL